MTDATLIDERPMRAVICSDCGQPTGDYSQITRSGLCGGCQPTSSESWSRNRAGIFAPQDGDLAFVRDPAFEDDEDAEPPRHSCPECGYDEFTLRTTAMERHSRTYTSHTDENGDLFFESGRYVYSDYDETVDEDVVRVECRGCGNTYHGDWEWS